MAYALSCFHRRLIIPHITAISLPKHCEYGIIILMQIQTVRNTILFSILLTFLIAAAAGLSYLSSSLAVERQHAAFVQSSNISIIQQSDNISDDVEIPSMVATPSDQP